QERLTRSRDLGLSLGDLSPRLEIDADNAHAVERLALDVLDVVDRSGQHPLVDENDTCLDLVGGHAEVLPDHADDGDVDLGQDVRGHAVDADGAQDGDQHCHHHKSISAAQRQSYDPHT